MRVRGGAAALEAVPGIEIANDHGNLQDLRMTSDPSDVLRRLVAAVDVQHFEVTRPSLHDIFVRIARPTQDELASEAVVA